jgi:hypothetical protein
MKFIKGFIMAVGVIGILAVVALLVGYYLFSLTPWIQAKMTPVTVTADAAKSFDQKLEAIKKEMKAAADAKEEKEVKLVLTEGEVNSKLIELLAEAKLPLDMSQVAINFREGQFLLYAVLDMPGVPAKIGLIGEVQVANNTPKIVVEEFNLGKLPLPQSASKGAEGLLNTAVKLQLTDWPMKITNVEIGKRQITVIGITKVAD